ncbi:hypothetical protein CLF_106474 [Clonorchis sinensis]|uniref:Uncharacterized protein n=1 Tax=Clonorchis sinensis TaxID=79923 RepID=G7YF86_CLOSI|nr:hypothetical protein CLF_106474 [Clonorchis sinensis]
MGVVRLVMYALVNSKLFAALHKPVRACQTDKTYEGPSLAVGLGYVHICGLTMEVFIIESPAKRRFYQSCNVWNGLGGLYDWYRFWREVQIGNYSTMSVYFIVLIDSITSVFNTDASLPSVNFHYRTRRWRSRL